jgi:tetratricopeptide (TPR) repeat protein
MCSGLGIAAIAARRPREALGHLTEALALMDEAGDRRGVGHAYNNIAAALGELHRFDEAIAACQNAYGTHAVNGHSLGMILALNNLGHLYARTGALELSLHRLELGLGLARKVGDRRLEAAVRHGMGETRREAGALDDALGHFGEALRLRRATGNRRYEARTLIQIGHTLTAAGRIGEALDALDEASVVAADIADEHLMSAALAALGRARLAVGDVPGARTDLAAAVRLRARVPDEHEADRLAAGLDELAAAEGRGGLTRSSGAG